ncbi:metal ABC transporter permease [Oceanivirga miroungae]|uniref:Manganese transport system membrane protein MntB n=1 Tax=Oceanivirga miroungae TaxID=1130046 RepID=A0A6I8MBX9_9FUSO|nr:metal ABC transporter permease [Oceanivirga miroungae]VWL85713.1 Manganese transport system membrane protein MntB [Oceanivirga miroungae]
MYLLNLFREYIISLSLNSYLPSFMQYNFVINALISAIFLGPILGIFGTLIITKKMAFFSEAIGHSALTGIALGIFLGENPTSPYIMLYGYCIIFAIIITYTKNKTKMSSDTLIGIFLSITIAIGGALIIIISSKANIHVLESLLFGSILTVNDLDIMILIVSTIVLLIITIPNYNNLILGSFNSNMAKIKGINVKFLDYLFIILVTLVTLASIKIIGTALVEALFLIPAASSKNISRSVKSFFWFSILFSLSSTILGILLPLILNIPLPSGGSIIMVSAVFFIITIIYKTLRKA